MVSGSSGTARRWMVTIAQLLPATTQDGDQHCCCAMRPPARTTLLPAQEPRMDDPTLLLLAVVFLHQGGSVIGRPALVLTLTPLHLVAHRNPHAGATATRSCWRR